MRIYGIGEFEQVLYRLDQKDEGSGILNYVVTEDPKGPLYLNVGLNLRSDFQNDTEWNILINLTRRSIGQLGAEWRNEAVIGSTQALPYRVLPTAEQRRLLFRRAESRLPFGAPGSLR